jgi:haloalkane dehalogenase
LTNYIGGILRTPDERFKNLPDYSFRPRYCELPDFKTIRIHYLDEGDPLSKTVILCLHGQPTWSYLYRKMIPVFAGAGYRVMAPDLIGFGRSDKPLEDTFYTFSRHRDMLISFVSEVILGQQPDTRITLVVQDWGGILGLTLPMVFEKNIHGLLVMNTSLGTGDEPLGQGFIDWRAFSNSRPDLDIAALMRRAEPSMSGAEADAYSAPFPDARFKAGVRRFPNLVPDHSDADGASISRAAREFLANRWEGRTLMAIGMRDPVLGPLVMHKLRDQIRGCPLPLEIAEAGHFVQEHGERIARWAVESGTLG